MIFELGISAAAVALNLVDDGEFYGSWFEMGTRSCVGVQRKGFRGTRVWLLGGQVDGYGGI